MFLECLCRRPFFGPAVLPPCFARSPLRLIGGRRFVWRPPIPAPAPVLVVSSSAVCCAGGRGLSAPRSLLFLLGFSSDSARYSICAHHGAHPAWARPMLSVLPVSNVSWGSAGVPCGPAWGLPLVSLCHRGAMSPCRPSGANPRLFRPSASPRLCPRFWRRLPATFRGH